MPLFFWDSVKTLQILGSYGACTTVTSGVSSQWRHDVWRSRQDKEDDKSNYRDQDDHDGDGDGDGDDDDDDDDS